MSKELCSAAGNLYYHVTELKIKMKAIYQAKLDLIYYPNTPKAELILSALLPKLEAELMEEKEQVEFYSKELTIAKYSGHEDYQNWYV